jgi:1-acyl-sn-glycerol-3-phosphate acyltransferase
MMKMSQLAPIGDAAASQGGARRRALRQWMQVMGSELNRRWLGDDFSERMAALHGRYAPALTGVDSSAVESAAKLLGLFHRFYFRTQVHGIENVPAGRVIIVANHSGQVPIDAAILGCSLFFDAVQPRLVRAMVDRWVAQLPFVCQFFSKIGSRVGTPTVAKELLRDEEALLVFPEGIRGISKPFSQRYQLQPFGHGFMRLALETDSPILPVAVIGAEEQYVNLGNSESIARLLKMPVYPLIPQMYLPFGQLPLPTKYRLYFGEPLRFRGRADAKPDAIAAQVHVVQKAIQSQLILGLQQRRGVFF